MIDDSIYVLVNVQCRGVYDSKPPDYEGVKPKGEVWFTVINPEALCIN